MIFSRYVRPTRAPSSSSMREGNHEHRLSCSRINIDGWGECGMGDRLGGDVMGWGCPHATILPTAGSHDDIEAGWSVWRALIRPRLDGSRNTNSVDSPRASCCQELAAGISRWSVDYTPHTAPPLPRPPSSLLPTLPSPAKPSELT